MNQEIEDIVAAIVAADQPSKILLFGSRARGDGHSGSDIDLAVIYENLDRNPFDVAVGLRLCLTDVTRAPVDLLVYDAERFHSRSVSATSFEHEVMTEGVLIYG